MFDNLLVFLIAYNSLLLLFLFILFINFLINNNMFENIARYKIDFEYRQILPKISVLVPARNEEEKIEECILSLLKQDYNNMEIIVLNDNSTDNTAKKAKNIIDNYNSDECTTGKKSIRLIEGLPLERGWVGKNFACYQLEKHATGDYILFTDADTKHNPDSVSSGLKCLISKKLDALSTYPEEILGTFGERMIIGFMKFGILLFIPIYLMGKIKSSLLTAALGSYIIYRRSVYRKVGGHKSIYNMCNEDINMAKLLIRNGFRYSIFDGSKIYTTRMYTNLGDIFKGYSRYIFTTFHYKRVLPLFLTFIISLILLFPFILIFIYPAIMSYGQNAININLFYAGLFLNLIQIFIIILIKAIYTTRFEGNAFDVICHPVSILYILFLGFNLVFSGNGKKSPSINWKGRKYVMNN